MYVPGFLVGIYSLICYTACVFAILYATIVSVFTYVAAIMIQTLQFLAG